MTGDAPLGTPARQLNLCFGAERTRHYPLPETHLAFVYRPLWDAARKLVLTYLCQPVPEKTRDPLSARYLCTALPADQLALDTIVLDRAANHIRALQRERCNILIACPMHFGTLSHAQNWAAFSQRLAALPAEVSAHLGVMLVGGDDAIRNARLPAEVAKLLPRVRFVYAVMAGARPVSATSLNGLHGIGCELHADAKPNAATAELLASLAASAKANRTSGFVLGVPNAPVLQKAVGSGMRFIEGQAIWPAMPNPTKSFPWTLDSPDQETVAL